MVHVLHVELVEPVYPAEGLFLTPERSGA